MKLHMPQDYKLLKKHLQENLLYRVNASHELEIQLVTEEYGRGSAKMKL